MTNRSWLRDAMPGSLANAVERTRPTLPMDEAVGRAVGNWVGHDQTTSRLAAAVAEPHLHRYLEDAGRVGRSHGWIACFVVWWPLTVAVTVAWIVLLAWR